MWFDFDTDMQTQIQQKVIDVNFKMESIAKIIAIEITRKITSNKY